MIIHDASMSYLLSGPIIVSFVFFFLKKNGYARLTKDKSS